MRLEFKPERDFSETLREFLAKRWGDLLTAGLALALGLLVARSTWYFLMPKKEAAKISPVQVSIEEAANAVIAANLFRGQAPAAEPAIEAASEFKLRGVFAGTDRLPAMAIINVPGKGDQPVRAGAEIVPGLELAAVYPDHVIVRRQGISERLNLERKPRIPGAGSSSAGFKLNVQSKGDGNFSFSRKELNRALQDETQLANLGRLGNYGGGGILIEQVPQGSLAEKLGLQFGDVVQRVNGQPVSTINDLMPLYPQLNYAEQVSLDGVRGGKPLHFKYTVKK